MGGMRGAKYPGVVVCGQGSGQVLMNSETDRGWGGVGWTGSWAATRAPRKNTPPPWMFLCVGSERDHGWGERCAPRSSPHKNPPSTGGVTDGEGWGGRGAQRPVYPTIIACTGWTKAGGGQRGAQRPSTPLQSDTPGPHPTSTPFPLSLSLSLSLRTLQCHYSSSKIEIFSITTTISVSWGWKPSSARRGGC